MLSGEKRKDWEMARFDLRAAPSLFREDGGVCCFISFWLTVTQSPLQPLLGSARDAPQRDDPNNGDGD